MLRLPQSVRVPAMAARTCLLAIGSAFFALSAALGATAPAPLPARVSIMGSPT